MAEREAEEDRSLCFKCMHCVEFQSCKRNKEETDKQTERASTKETLVLILCFFTLGLSNNFGYVAYNTGAADIIDKTVGYENFTNLRECQSQSTAVILLSQILPGFAVKMIASFTPLFMTLRVIIIVSSQITSFLIVAFTDKFWVVLIGMVFMSLPSELGEATFLQYSSLYHNDYSVSGWSSGTGGAGILGAIGIHVLFEITSYSITFLCMLSIPITMAMVYVLMPKAEDKSKTLEQVEEDARMDFYHSVIRKIKMFPSLSYYIFPLAFVYFFEYIINQGLFILVHYDGIKVSKNEQYRIFTIMYQLGVFLSRSSLCCVRIKFVWALCFAQFSIFALFLLDAIWGILPSLYISSFIILIEGLIGGLSYVNTYNNIRLDLEGEKKEFCTSISTLINSIFICLSGVVSMYLHQGICKLPPFHRKVWF